jgi:hypothetical protein
MLPTALFALMLPFAPLQDAPKAAPPHAPAPMKAVEDPTLAADLALLATLDVPFEGGSKTFVNATVEEILAAVRASCRAQIEADRRVFGDSGGWELARLDCNASTPRQALDAVAAALTDVTRSVGIDVAAGLVVFTDMIESATRLAAVRHYDLRPVLLRRDLRDVSTEFAMDDIQSLLQESVDPLVWRDNGGDGAWSRIFDTTLVVNASPVRHQAIARFLAQLEASLPSPTVQWQVRVVELSNEVPAEDLRVVLDSAGQLDLLISMGGGRLLSAPKIVSGRFDPASMKVGSDTDSIEVSIEPLGSLAFAVEIKETRIGTTRSLMLRALDGIRSAGILEGNGRRLLVEIQNGATPAGEKAAKPVAND